MKPPKGMLPLIKAEHDYVDFPDKSFLEIFPEKIKDEQISAYMAYICLATNNFHTAIQYLKSASKFIAEENTDCLKELSTDITKFINSLPK